MYYTVIKHKPQASVFYILLVFSNVKSVLSQCNKQLKLLYLLYDIDFACRELKHQSSHIYKLTAWCFIENSIMNFFKRICLLPSLTRMLIRGNVAKNNKTRFFYDLYSDKTWVFDQSERA